MKRSVAIFLFIFCVLFVVAGTASACAPYVVKGTSQEFNWISPPTWEIDSVKNTCRIYSFVGNYKENQNQIALQINVYDFSVAYRSFSSREKQQQIKECISVIKKDVKSSFSSLKTIEERFDEEKLTYFYKFETYYGGDITYVVLVNFSVNQLVAYRAMYKKGYQFAEKEIIEPYLNQFK